MHNSTEPDRPNLTEQDTTPLNRRDGTALNKSGHYDPKPTSLVTIKVDNLRARIAADLAEQTIERLKQQGATVVVIEEQQE